MIRPIRYNNISIPPDAAYFLNRPHISNLLKTALKKPVTTVIAGAGYGKTQAVSAALDSMACKIIWLQLSELDNLITRLWSRFVLAIKPHNNSLSNNLSALGFPESAASYDQCLRLLAKELMYQERFVIVLDDLHTIHEKSILDFFEKVIREQIPNLSVVLISRTKPNLSLAGMLSKGLLARITEEDLRFSKDEMETYYQKQGVNLSSGMVSTIYAYTEGWIFAIYLVGLSIKKGNTCDQNPIFMAQLDIFELIEKEVFVTASEELQNFLINISRLDVCPLGLLTELAADHSCSVVSEMTQISLLVRYDSVTDSYRLHNLFKAFLLERADKPTEQEIRKTQITAAKWHQSHNQPIVAINYYHKYNCYDEIFDIILSVNEYVSKEVGDSFIHLIEQAPDEIMQRRPIMLVLKSKYQFNNNRISEAQKDLLLLQQEYESMPVENVNQAVLGEAYLMLALISIVNQNLDFKALFKKADALLPEGSTLVGHRLNIADGINVCGIQNPTAGELKRYQEALFTAAPYASRVMNGCGYGMEYLNAADSAFMTGDIANAEKYVFDAIYRAQQQKQHGFELMANFILIRIYMLKGDYTRIAILLMQMQDNLETFQNSDCIFQYDIIVGWFHVKIGETSKVCKWIMHEDETKKTLSPLILGREYLVHSDCLLAEERYFELLAFMEYTDIIYASRGVLYALIQNKITKSIICHYIGDHKESMKALQDAYVLSSPNGLIVQYIEYGNKMRTVINAAKQDPDCSIPKSWLDMIYAKSSTYAKRLAQVSQEYKASNGMEKNGKTNLSKRESEILDCICHGLTREEIALNCNLSVNTVKSILQNVYSKLGAINSIDAVRIATTLNLAK